MGQSHFNPAHSLGLRAIKGSVKLTTVFFTSEAFPLPSAQQETQADADHVFQVVCSSFPDRATGALQITGPTRRALSRRTVRSVCSLQAHKSLRIPS